MYGSRAEIVDRVRFPRQAGRGPAQGPVVLSRDAVRRAVELTGRSRRATEVASRQVAAAAGQLTILRDLQRSKGRRWYRFIRMRGGSQTHQVVPAVFKFSGRLAKGARRVSVVGPFNQWNPAVHPLTRTTDGDWNITIYLPPGRIIYHFDVDGTFWLDPADEGRVPNAWGTHYSVRNLAPTPRRSPSPASPELPAPIRGGAQVVERVPESTPEILAGAAAEDAGPFPLLRSVERDSAAGSGTPSLVCRVEQWFEVWVLHVRGEIDLTTVATFQIALDEALATGRSVVLLLRETRYLDSAGLCCLSRVRSQLPAHGQRLVLAEPSRPVRRAIKAAGLDERFPIFSSVEGALHYLVGSAQDALRRSQGSGTAK